MAEPDPPRSARRRLAADVAVKGEDALWMAGATDYDAIVLDIGLPGSTASRPCRRLRSDGVWAPVLMLTAREAVDDRVKGLDGGADDYMAKPFAFDELLARLRALARRGAVERPTVLCVGSCALDPAARHVSARRGGGRAVDQGARAARGVHAPTGRGPLALPAARARPGTRTTRTARTWSTSTSATCATRSTDRSASRASRPCAARVTA